MRYARTRGCPSAAGQNWASQSLSLARSAARSQAPELATGDGALGFWKALREVYGTTREQRCWVHKTANVLNKLPKSVQPRAKAFDFFLEAHGPKEDKAVACLAKDRDVLLAFYDFPAEHWKHIRTTNPIESTFATVRLRTTKTKGCLSRMTALTMVFKPWRTACRFPRHRRL